MSQERSMWAAMAAIYEDRERRKDRAPALQERLRHLAGRAFAAQKQGHGDRLELFGEGGACVVVLLREVPDFSDPTPAPRFKFDGSAMLFVYGPRAGVADAMGLPTECVPDKMQGWIDAGASEVWRDDDDGVTRVTLLGRFGDPAEWERHEREEARASRRYRRTAQVTGRLHEAIRRGYYEADEAARRLGLATATVQAWLKHQGVPRLKWVQVEEVCADLESEPALPSAEAMAVRLDEFEDARGLSTAGAARALGVGRSQLDAVRRGTAKRAVVLAVIEALDALEER